MIENLQLIMRDIKDSVYTLNFQDMMRIFMLSMWFLIILFPLGKNDTRDYITASMYVLFSIASGIMLVYALPQKLMPPQSLNTIITTMIFMGLVAGLRWFYTGKKQENIELLEKMKKNKAEKKGETSGAE